MNILYFHIFPVIPRLVPTPATPESRLLVLLPEPCYLTIPYYSYFSLSLSLSLSFSVPFLFPLSFPFLLPFLSIPPMSIPGSMTQYCLMPALVPRLTPFNYISSELIDNESKQAATTSLCKRARFASLLAKRRSGAARRAT